MIEASTLTEPYYRDGDAVIRRFHAGQWQAWDSMKRFIFMLAGSQGGKTAFGPHWLYREIYDDEIGCGSGDYLAVTASYDLFKLKMLPALREVFEHLYQMGRYWAGDKIIELRNPVTGKFEAKKQDDQMWGRIILRSARSDGGLESTTAKAAWGDECGQDDFTALTWQAIRRRLALHRGRFLGTTTLYVLYNWLKELYNEWRDGRPDIDIIQFASITNPAFPHDEYEQALREYPEHVVNMFYRGEYDKPPGMIYDSFNDQMCVIPPFAIDPTWPAYGGLDFGGTNMAAIRVRHDIRTKTYYITDEYLEGGKEIAQHARTLKHWGCRHWRGGAGSEDQYRREFAAAGLPVVAPDISDVWVGINRVYGLHKQNRIMVFDTCERYLGQKGSYSRKINKATGEPIPDEINNKNQYHILDAERYIMSFLAGGVPELPQENERLTQSRRWDVGERETETGSKWNRF